MAAQLLPMAQGVGYIIIFRLTCKAKWIDGRLGIIPNLSSDILLFNIIIIDSISLRFGLDNLDSNGIYPFYIYKFSIFWTIII